MIAIDDPRRTVPRDVGQQRPAKDLQLDWWVHLQPLDGHENDPDGYPVWAQVVRIADTNLGNRILTMDLPAEAGNTTKTHRDDIVTMLTAQAARRLGLRADPPPSAPDTV